MPRTFAEILVWLGAQVEAYFARHLPAAACPRDLFLNLFLEQINYHFSAEIIHPGLLEVLQIPPDGDVPIALALGVPLQKFTGQTPEAFLAQRTTPRARESVVKIIQGLTEEAMQRHIQHWIDQYVALAQARKIEEALFYVVLVPTREASMSIQATEFALFSAQESREQNKQLRRRLRQVNMRLETVSAN